MKKLLFVIIMAAMAVPAMAGTPTISLSQSTGSFDYDTVTSIFTFNQTIDVTHGFGDSTDPLAVSAAYVIIPDLKITGTTVAPDSSTMFLITDGVTDFLSGTLGTGSIVDGGAGVFLYTATLSDISGVSVIQTVPVSPALAAIQNYLNAGGTTVDLALSLTHAGANILANGVTGGDISGSMTVPIVDVCLGSIGDTVWNDADGNGIQDAGEMGIEGVRVILDNGQSVIDTVTDATGFYMFDGLCPGIYTVSVDSSTVAADMIATLINAAGSTTENDSDNPTGTLVVLAEGEDMTIDFGYVEVIEQCQECMGKITELTLEYNGGAAATVIVLQKDGQAVFNALLNPGETFTIIGLDDKGTLGTEINLYIDGVLNANIHTSCSEPIGPGLVAGDFTVIEGYSFEGGLICPVDTPPTGDDCDCEGKVTDLTLQYLGSETDADILVVGKIHKKGRHDKKDKHDKKGKHGKKGKKEDAAAIVSQSILNPGDIFTIVGNDKHGTLGTEINLLVNGMINANFHTSCSKPIGPGLISGDFLVVEGNSRQGGPLCPVESTPPVSVDCECDGKVTQLTMQFTGVFDESTKVTVKQKDGVIVFDDFLNTGDVFVINGLDNGTLGTEINLYVDGVLNANIHTSCSKPIGPGMVAGDFLVTEGYSRNGGKLCPLP